LAAADTGAHRLSGKNRCRTISVASVCNKRYWPTRMSETAVQPTDYATSLASGRETPMGQRTGSHFMAKTLRVAVIGWGYFATNHLNRLGSPRRRRDNGCL